MITQLLATLLMASPTVTTLNTHQLAVTDSFGEQHIALVGTDDTIGHEMRGPRQPSRPPRRSPSGPPPR